MLIDMRTDNVGLLRAIKSLNDACLLGFLDVVDLYEKGIGGGGEIRTHGRVTPTAVFKTAALNRSATPPCLRDESYLLVRNLASTIV